MKNSKEIIKVGEVEIKFLLESSEALLHGYVGCRLMALGIPKLVKRFRQAALMRASPC
jgi:hypothetical protein